MISQAKKMASKGQAADAIDLAKKAEKQGQDALAQDRREFARYSENH